MIRLILETFKKRRIKRVSLENIVGVKEVAEILGLREGTVKNMAAAGKVKAKKIGNVWVFDKKYLLGIHEKNKIEKMITHYENMIIQEKTHYDFFISNFPTSERIIEIEKNIRNISFMIHDLKQINQGF